MPLYYEFYWYELYNKANVTSPLGSNEWIIKFEIDKKAQLLGDGVENITLTV